MVIRILSILILLAMAIMPVHAGSTVIKVAAVTPEGSTWVKVLRVMASEVEAQTQGGIKFTIYAGGITGDESDVLRKMRVNRIHAAGFSGVGLGIILPRIRVMEAPLLFNSEAEIDTVRNELFDDFAAQFDKKGFVLLGFVEGGWVYLFSKQNLSVEEGFASANMWVWKGDRVAEMLLNNFGMRTTPLHVADVTTGLERGMIDSFYSPPLAAIAFQWHTRVRYMLDYPLANSNAALLMTKRAFNALPADHQATLKELSRKHCRDLVARIRQDNQMAREVMQSQGATFVPPSTIQIERFSKGAQKTYSQSIPNLYPRALFERIQQILSRLRKTAP